MGPDDVGAAAAAAQPLQRRHGDNLELGAPSTAPIAARGQMCNEEKKL